MSYLYKNNFEEVYRADVGNISKIKDPKSKYNNKLIYVEGGTFNGSCYKDYKNFENNPDDICYIAECKFGYTLFVDHVNENKETLISEGGFATANSIKKSVKKDLINGGYFYEYDKKGNVCTIKAEDFDDELINEIAKDVFDIIDWQTPSAFIYETDWGEFIEEYYDKKLNKGVEVC